MSSHETRHQTRPEASTIPTSPSPSLPSQSTGSSRRRGRRNKQHNENFVYVEPEIKGSYEFDPSINPVVVKAFTMFLEFHCPEEFKERYEKRVIPFIHKLSGLLTNVSFDPHKVILQQRDTINMSRCDIAITLASGMMLVLSRNYFTFWGFLDAVDWKNKSQGSKMRCLLHYFDVVMMRYESVSDGEMESISYATLNAGMKGHVLFLSRVIKPVMSASWASSNVPLCDIVVDELGTIESEGKADFANKKIGGGALRRGCVQEEIRFVINPECLVSMLLKNRPMTSLESITILGTERFSNYLGYSRSFQYAGPHRDETEAIEFNGSRYINTCIVAIDAAPRISLEDQFTEGKVFRELNKALSGFTINEWERHTKVLPVATGNWGCGAFGGCIQLKSLIQWMACSVAERPSVQYYTFKDMKAKGTSEIVSSILKAEWTVGKLYSNIMMYNSKTWEHSTLYEFLSSRLEK